MGEAEQTTDAGVSNDGQTPEENKVSIDRAEFERLQERDRILSETDEWATEAEIEGGTRAYIEVLESIANEKSASSDPAPDPARTEKKDIPPAPTPPPAGLSAAELAKIEAATKASTIALLSAQQSEWQRQQDSLPVEDRSPMTAAELGKLIQRQPTLFKSLASDREHSGNLFKAANAYALSTSEGMRKVREHAAAIQKAKDDAGSAANLNTGGPTATPTTTSEHDRLLAKMKAEADKIAPDDPPYEMPI